MLKEYINELRAQGFRASYLTGIGEKIRYFQRYCEKDWKEINDEDVFNFFLNSTPYTRLSFSTYKYVLSAYFVWLEHKGYVLAVPGMFNRLKLPTGDKMLSVLTEAEVEGILSHPLVTCHPKLKPIITLLYAAGLRRAEVVNLCVDDIDFSGSVFVKQGKGGKDRIVPVPKAALNVLKQYLQFRRTMLRCKDTSRLFFKRDWDAPITNATLSCLVNDTGRQMGIPLNCHIFRRSIATHLSLRGMPISHIGTFLGHDSLEVTQRYVKLADSLAPVGLLTLQA